MNKEEIERKLAKNWCKQGAGWRELVRAKNIICPEDKVINGHERDFRMSVIIDYLKI